MPEETTPPESHFAAPSCDLPDVENLADSDDPDVITARAKLLEAQAKLAKATIPLFDKIVLRGLLPIALAIVGPWALWKFDKATTEQEKQGVTITQLEELLESATKEAAERKKRNVEWRDRMKTLEDSRAVELTAMSHMVCRLDDTLKLALVQMAVTSVIAEGEKSEVRGTSPTSPTPRVAFTRKQAIQNVAEQIQLPGVEKAEVERLAARQYDRVMEQRQR